MRQPHCDDRAELRGKYGKALNLWKETQARRQALSNAAAVQTEHIDEVVQPRLNDSCTQTERAEPTAAAVQTDSALPTLANVAIQAVCMTEEQSIETDVSELPPQHRSPLHKRSAQPVEDGVDSVELSFAVSELDVSTAPQDVQIVPDGRRERAVPADEDDAFDALPGELDFLLDELLLDVKQTEAATRAWRTGSRRVGVIDALDLELTELLNSGRDV